MGKFVVSTRKNGEVQFVLKAGNGETILVSEGYKSMSGCNNGIKSVRINSQDDDRYERKQSSNGKYMFNLRAGNGQVIGTSEMYESNAACNNGIASVKRNAPGATIETA
jgi:uncharacterized protein